MCDYTKRDSIDLEKIILHGPQKEDGWVFGVTTITPEIATFLLEKYNTHNRNVTKLWFEKYKTDMINEAWLLTGATIILCKTKKLEWVLGDGQKRLMACVASKKLLRTFIIIGLDVSIQKCIDISQTRTPAQCLRLKGCTWATNKATSVFTVASRAPMWDSNKMTPDLIEKMHKKYKKGFNIIAPFCNTRGIAPLLAVFLRAFYHRKKYGLNSLEFSERVRKFVDIFVFGQSHNKEESAAMALRNRFCSYPGKKVEPPKPNLRYRYCQVAVVNFLNKNPIEKCRERKEDIFPLI